MPLEKALPIAAAIVAAGLASGAPATKMMKPGMKRGDVKKDADERLRNMKPALGKEEKSMEQGKLK